MKRFLKMMESQNRKMQRHYLGLGFIAAVILFASAISIPLGFSSHGVTMSMAMAERKLDEEDKLDQILKVVKSVKKKMNKDVIKKINGLETKVKTIVDTIENVAEIVDANQEKLDALLSCACQSNPPSALTSPSRTPSVTPSTKPSISISPTTNRTTAVEIDEIWEELLALEGVNWAYRARDSKSDTFGTPAASGDAVVSISAAGNDIPSVNELEYLGKNYSSMQLYYAELESSPTFVDRGGGDEYIRFFNGPASNYETNPGQLSPREALEEDFHLIHLFRAMPGARYEGSITGGISWKDRAGDGQQIQFFAPGATAAALGPSGAVTVMGMDNIVDVRLFAANGIAEFRLNGDLLITTSFSNTTGISELVLGTNSHVMANHFRAVFINRGAHFTNTELASIEAKTDRLWPRGEMPTFPYLSAATPTEPPRGTALFIGDAVVSISAAGNDIPSVNELEYLGKNYSSMQLYYAELESSPTFVDRGGGDEYIRFFNGPASNYETNPGQLSPREALEEDFHLIHLFRAMPGARYEGSITGGISWKDRAGDGQQIQFFAPGATAAALGPSGAVTVMGMDNIVDVRLFAAKSIAEFRLNGDLLITTDTFSNTTGISKLVLGTNSHVMANHFRAVFINRGAHFTNTELASIEAKTDRLWPRGEMPTFPYLSAAHTNRATTWDRTLYIWSPEVSGFSGGNGVEGNHRFQWYYWDQTLAPPAGNTFTEDNPLRSHLAIPGATGASLHRSAHPDVFVRPGDGSVRIMRVVTPRDSDGTEGELLVGEWAYDNINLLM
eukprot:CAMPEP_0194395966 /NCGR_PEP_ID=MMETSP0174-20130528/124714_1 /TAXON_ID=216777 /ORGANISM="Proboscia alata, Strain PI-D3" /LENGTH=785 /DNA_ID=CAMNT_0039191957 /DNA_START=5 /DNA_END=2363 /DNA_ORIENTATION=-